MPKLTELASSRELLANLTLRELRGKYKRSVLGWTWSLLNPLATMAIFTFVFRLFLKIQPPVGDPSGLHNFAFFLLCGLLPWNFLANGMSGAIGMLVANGNLIKKVYFPREILVAASVLSWDVSLLIELGVLAVALLIVGSMVLPWLPVVLLLVVVLSVFVLGVGLGLSVLNVYFRDVQHFLAIFMQLWFYATPVVYPISYVPERADVLGLDIPVRTLYDLNPMVRFVGAFRNCLYDLRFPALADLAYMCAAALISLAIGAALFNRLEPRLAEEL
ncbi:MAG TPA: ABC transporter permease [Acidimicrobiales bacterium]|nr:ABC transporter permease [Acidimicrobiales bacterium]